MPDGPGKQARPSAVDSQWLLLGCAVLSASIVAASAPATGDRKSLVLIEFIAVCQGVLIKVAQVLQLLVGMAANSMAALLALMPYTLPLSV